MLSPFILNSIISQQRLVAEMTVFVDRFDVTVILQEYHLIFFLIVVAKIEVCHTTLLVYYWRERERETKTIYLNALTKLFNKKYWMWNTTEIGA